MQKYPIGIQDFSKIRQEQYLYIDKTKLIYDIVSQGSYYFLSRPRRFGKSLLISTLEAYFRGRRELFEGLAIADLEHDWKEYTILHIDLNTAKYDALDSLDKVLNDYLVEWEGLYGARESETDVWLRFPGVIRRAYEKTGRQVVILVDEYDKPMLQAIGNDELQNEYRGTLKAFYSALKTCDRYIKFAFLTGVTKFGKVSVFSDLNNLIDISMLPQFVSICGISEDELHIYMDNDVMELANTMGISKTECYQILKEKYDGYHFHQNTIGIYNPFSLLNTLQYHVISDYWFETGTPTFLVELLKRSNYRLENLVKERITSDVINSIDTLSMNPVPVIYQSGYLTIKGYDQRFRKYLLGFPNEEVEHGFLNFLAPRYTAMTPEHPEFAIENFVEDVEAGNAEGFMHRLEAFFADGNYQVVGNAELYFQNTAYVLFKLLGFYVQVERPTSDGRIDILILTADYVYILELKRDSTAEAALQQIDDKQYALPFAADKRRLFKIGVNFSTESRRVDDWKIVE